MLPTPGLGYGGEKWATETNVARMAMLRTNLFNLAFFMPFGHKKYDLVFFIFGQKFGFFHVFYTYIFYL